MVLVAQPDRAGCTDASQIGLLGFGLATRMWAFPFVVVTTAACPMADSLRASGCHVSQDSISIQTVLRPGQGMAWPPTTAVPSHRQVHSSPVSYPFVKNKTKPSHSVCHTADGTKACCSRGHHK